MSNSTPPTARDLGERFSPHNGIPLRLGSVWPPRLVVHNACTKADADRIEVTANAWIRHHTRGYVKATLRPNGLPTDGDGRTFPGLTIEAVETEMRPAGRGAKDLGFHPMDVKVTWDRRFSNELQDVPWVRLSLSLVLSDGKSERQFQWYLYITPFEAELPLRSSEFDDHPHYRWLSANEGPISLRGVAQNWIELPAPMSGPTLPPACWVQDPDPEQEDKGPETVKLVPIFPVEPAIKAGIEAVGWNGALGGHDPRPRIQPLAVDSHQAGRTWGSMLHYWDTPLDGGSHSVRHARLTALEEPTDCVWPEILSADATTLVLYDLLGLNTSGCEVKLNLRISLPETVEAVRIQRAEIRLGGRVVGHWQGPEIDMYAGQVRSLPCVIDIHRLREAADGRLKLTIAFKGRPRRGVIEGDHVFRTDNGPFARLNRSRTEGGKVRTPWLAIDLGTEGTCAAVSFLDGYVPRVVSVMFDEGPIYPSRVYLSPDLTGTWQLTDEPAADSLYTTLIKMGLRFGDGAHPGCPDHVPATEVARFFLKRFLLEVRDRMAWFPLEEANVLVSFPPRLATLPRFVSAMHETFSAVLDEVIWTGEGKGELRFREEAFLVAVPSLFRDLEVQPMDPATSRYYWVMDFGGGTTDVCGFLCTADAYGEEHTVSHMTYPQRLSHHLAGNDVTRAFYSVLYRHLDQVGLVRGPETEEDGGRSFPIPSDPFPSVRSTSEALSNQTALRELADALKCIQPSSQPGLNVRTLARSLSSTTIRSAEGVTTTLVALLAAEAAGLGDSTVPEVHAAVLNGRGEIQAADVREHPLFESSPQGLRPRRSSEKARVRCTECDEIHTLPLWAFASNRAFRFRCRQCGYAQRVQLSAAAILPDAADGAPTIVDYRDVRVQESEGQSDPAELYLEQDGRTFHLRDFDTLRRWVSERRVGPDDLFSEGGISWQALRERPELQGLFEEAEVLAVDVTHEVTSPVVQIAESEPQTVKPIPGLARDIELFLAACREAMERSMNNISAADDIEVVVLVAGRASQFGPITKGIREIFKGRVIHLTNQWVRRSYGNAGQIDPNADLKTLTVNGGGLFALLQSNAETSHLLLSFDIAVMDSATYLQAASTQRPWLITRRLDLRPGSSAQVVPERDALDFVEDLGTSSEEPPPRPLPRETALTGDLCIVVEGLSEDRDWEPYVTIAQGTARRHQGRRPRTTSKTLLRTEEDCFVLGPLSGGRQIEFDLILPRLNLLGGSSAGSEPTAVSADKAELAAGGQEPS